MLVQICSLSQTFCRIPYILNNHLSWKSNVSCYKKRCFSFDCRLNNEIIIAIPADGNVVRN